MGDIVQQIALVAERYHRENKDVFHPGDFAELLAGELGITQEWGLRSYTGNAVLWKSADRHEPRSRETEFPEMELVERDVMPWLPDRHRNRSHVGATDGV